jgi:hypothetical protein
LENLPSDEDTLADQKNLKDAQISKLFKWISPQAGGFVLGADCVHKLFDGTSSINC